VILVETAVLWWKTAGFLVLLELTQSGVIARFPSLADRFPAAWFSS
jgi:hypothetical protein